jgi:serine phosphatase RsbU (regulator of sigma subunit)/HAMP domain-containing protein
MKQTTVFRQLIYNIVFPVVIALFVLGVINFRNTRVILQEGSKSRNFLISDEITQVLKFQDVTMAVLENYLNPILQEVSNDLIENYFVAGKKVETIDLNKIREELKLESNIFDIYVIDTNGVVVNTTFKEDMGLNFFSFGEEHKSMIKKIFREGKFKSEKFTIEAKTRRLKKYTYQTTLDKNHIIELGVYSSTADQIVTNIRETLEKLSIKEKSIVSAELFMNADNPFSLTRKDTLEAREKAFIKERFVRNDSILVEKKIDQQYLAYQYFYTDSKNSDLYNGSVIRIVSDKTEEIRNEYYRLISFVIIFILVLLTIIVLIYLKTRNITNPIKNLVTNVNRITEGNLSVRAEVAGNNEITTLSQTFNGMIEQLQELYTDLDNKVKVRTAQVVSQKEEIEAQRDEIEKHRDHLAEQQKHILDSINYAKRLQLAILPTDAYIKELFPESFIVFQPKDIVSGDIYWFNTINGKKYFSAIDCTGHGVPGALVSMVGHNCLDYALKDLKLERPVDILEALNVGVTATFKEKDEDGAVKDGMDIALCCVDYRTMKMEFAGAYNPAFLIRNGELIQLKGDKCAIGAFSQRAKSGYTNQEIDIVKGDMVYVFSDGYADQFGGESGRKFMIANFKKLLIEVHAFPVEQQKSVLEETFFEWMKVENQLDDILVVGVRI